MRALRSQRGVAATGGADLQRADGAEAAGAAGRTDHRATQAFAVSDLLHPGQAGASCAANPAAAGAELAALFQLALCPALAALAGVRLTQTKSSQAKPTQQPGARGGKQPVRKYTARGLAPACESACRCHELYRVSRRPCLIAARPPEVVFNFLRTDYGRASRTG